MEIFNVGTKDFNSYLICGEKNILIDTVPKEYSGEFLKKLIEIVPIEEISAVIFTRTTPHSTGAISDILKKKPDIAVFATVAGLKNLKEITNVEFFENVIKNDGIIDIGEDLLSFIIAPNLSWPDTALLYMKNERALFSGNLFCESPEREAFGKVFLESALKRIFELDVRSVYPAYKTACSMDMYNELINSDAEDRLAIIYESTSGQTEELARIVCLEALSCGMSAILLDTDKMLTDEILKIAEDSKYLAFGTPTINHNATYGILRVIISMNVLKNADKKAFVFGSYGWSGEGVNIVSGLISNLKIRPYKKPYRCIFNPSAENLEDLKKEVRNFIKECQDA